MVMLPFKLFASVVTVTTVLGSGMNRGHVLGDGSENEPCVVWTKKRTASCQAWLTGSRQRVSFHRSLAAAPARLSERVASP